MAKKPPPKPPAKKVAAKRAPAKAQPPAKKQAPAKAQPKAAPKPQPKAKAKVVDISAGRKKAAAKKKEGKKKGPPRFRMLALFEYGNGRVHTKLFTKVSPYEQLHPDPEQLLLERANLENGPTPQLRRAISKLVRLGSDVRAAFANFGVSRQLFQRWQQQAQRDFMDGNFESPCLLLFQSVEISEAQGEVQNTIDARMQTENAFTFLRTRYARNWDAKMAGAAAATFIEAPEEAVPVEDEQGAYILSILEGAHGGNKPASEAVIDTVADVVP